jgi:cell division protein FtsZ
MAIQSPLLDNISVEGAMGVLINIVGGPDMKMKEIDEAATLVQEQAHEDANIIFGASVDENMGDMIKVTVIATGFDHQIAEIPAQLATQQSSRPAPPIAVQTAPMTSRAPAAPGLGAPRSSLRAETREEVAAFSARRPGAAMHHAGSPSVAPPSAPRERQSFVPPLDSDWDTPAFQRRGQ